jgi:hypothetical protein
MKKLLSFLIIKYVRVFPKYRKAVICRFANNCARCCPCNEHGMNALYFDFVCNYGNRCVKKQSNDKEES